MKRKQYRYRALRRLSLPEEAGACTWQPGDAVDVTGWSPDRIQFHLDREALERLDITDTDDTTQEDNL